MKRHAPLTAATATLALLGLVATATAEQGTPETLDEKVSYSVGYQVGGDFKRQRVELNLEVMLRGVKDGFSGGDPALSPKEMDQVLRQLKQKIVAIQQESREMASRKADEQGKKFMKDNAEKKGVMVTDSGLQYQVLEKGVGAAPSASSTVSVHYRGTLVDGSEFDSSYSRGQPSRFALNRVIKGWTEGLQLMKQGAKYRFVIPPELGYGPRGTRTIPSNSTLIFEVELLEVENL